MRELAYYDLGLIDYEKAWELQRKTFDLRRNKDVPDILYLLEHPHTYTLGKVADRKNLIGSENYLKENGISVYDIDRGGDITYHGPGQIVGYPILDLAEWKQDTHLYLRSIEEVIILTCQDYGLRAGRIEKLTGVWIEDRKIAAIGIKVSRWITMHGFAFNVNTDLSLFQGIIPCGITDKSVTSLSKELGYDPDMNEVKEKLVNNFKNVFHYDVVKTGPENQQILRSSGLP
ncbi:MAG: lipoyl(octanoyl) transferase LipB [Bacteroidota bacterium]